MARILGAVRLSRLVDETTSPARQREAIELTARIRGDEVVAIAEDLDVSGSVSAWARDLAPWLSDDPPKSWDVLVVHKLDRLTRSLLDFQRLITWLREHDKSLVSVSESIDLSTAAGKMVANVLVMFAEFERERAAERRREAAGKLRQLGAWNGGRPPYGYRLIPDGAGHYGLAIDPATAAIVREHIVAPIIDGAHMSRVCDALNAASVPTPRGAPQWKVSALKRIVTSRYLRGELIYKRATVLDGNGAAQVLAAEPLITEAQWAQLQDALAAKARPRSGKHSTAHLLLRIAHCGECGAPMYHQRNAERSYYRCADWRSHPGGIRALRAEFLESLVEHSLLERFGEAQIERRLPAPDDQGPALSAAQRRLAELEEQMVSGALTAQRFASVAARIEAQIAELSAKAAAAAEPQWQPTGETVRQRWDATDVAGRHEMLLRLGITWHLHREYRVSDRASRWKLESEWYAREGARERLARAA